MLRSLRYRLSLIFIGLATVPVVLVGGLLGQRIFTALENNALEAQQADAVLMRLEVEKFIEETERDVRRLEEFDRISRLDLEEQENLVSRLVASSQAYQEVALLDSSGQETLRVVRGEPIMSSRLINRADDVAFQAALNSRESYYSSVYFDEALREPLLTLAVPIFDVRRNETSAVLLASIRFKPIWDLLAEREQAESEAVYITDGAGRIIAHANPSLVLRNTTVTLPEKNGRNIGLNGNEVISASEILEFGGQKFVVVAENSLSEALELAYTSLYIAVAITLIALLAAVVVIFFAVRYIVRPIEDLSGTAKQIADGNLALRAQVKSRDEIGTLAQAFNTMTDQLRSLIHGLEARVRARTQDIELAASVSRQATKELDLNKLLRQIVELTRSGFDLYFVGVFLFDEQTRTLNLKAGTGDAGERLIKLGKSFNISDPYGLVPTAARKLELMLSNDVTTSLEHFFNPILPNTRSELALPMVVGQRLIGVMDLQSEQINRFSEEDLRSMTLLSEQLAVAVQNAQLFADQLRLNEELRQLDQMKSQFMASVSHELRTPLNAIINLSEFVLTEKYGPINAEQRHALTDTVSSSKHLLALINDVMDITKIESGGLQLFVEENIDPRREIENVLATAQGLRGQKSIELIVDVEDPLPCLVGDRRRIRQILLNLVSNAVKFTEKGRVTIQARQENQHILFAVKDTGPGIAPEQQELIFEAFQQGSEGLKHGGGTGLGLPISRRLAEAHNGKLWLESTPGLGSSFYVSLPIRSEALLKLID